MKILFLNKEHLGPDRPLLKLYCMELGELLSVVGSVRDRRSYLPNTTARIQNTTDAISTVYPSSREPNGCTCMKIVVSRISAQIVIRATV